MQNDPYSVKRKRDAFVSHLCNAFQSWAKNKTPFICFFSFCNVRAYSIKNFGDIQTIFTAQQSERTYFLRLLFNYGCCRFDFIAPRHHHLYLAFKTNYTCCTHTHIIHLSLRVLAFSQLSFNTRFTALLTGRHVPPFPHLYSTIYSLTRWTIWQTYPRSTRKLQNIKYVDCHKGLPDFLRSDHARLSNYYLQQLSNHKLLFLPQRLFQGIEYVLDPVPLVCSRRRSDRECSHINGFFHSYSVTGIVQNYYYIIIHRAVMTRRASISILIVIHTIAFKVTILYFIKKKKKKMA